jgi:iron complex transport system ATP-binding protein
MPATNSSEVVLEVRGVSVVREGRHTLNKVDLAVATGQRWVILGPNGCGKTTLLKLLSLYLHPSSGDVVVQGELLGRFDTRKVRPRIAFASASLAEQIRGENTAADVVMTAKNGALETWWHQYDASDRARAMTCLAQMGVDHFADRPMYTLSSGEQQRVLLARTLMNDPIAVLLDEPSARLDLGGREQLVGVLDNFARNNPALPSVVVTHHVDEIPTSTTHCMLLRNGNVIAAGAIGSALTSQSLTECFGIDLVLDSRPNGRLTAYAR